MCELALKIVMKNTVENVNESQKKCVTVPGLQKPQQSQTGIVKRVEKVSLIDFTLNFQVFLNQNVLCFNFPNW